ncbi:c-type cytochrome [Arhodomonas sp. SL1]|uniref:c-type cytochrome n=1 Tax=Arhodomonas sp. SL1 TaxID=3425691 RepID=UPI003F881594
MSDRAPNARGREHPEPEEGDRPIPVWVYQLVGGLFLWGGFYLVAHTGYPLNAGDARTPLPAAASEAGEVSGATVYNSNCASCHQGNGQGVPGTFPPLADSDWVSAGDGTRAAAIVLRGLNGPIEVQGTTYEGQMPAFAGSLSDAEIAAVLSHIRQSWGNHASPVTTARVAELRESMADAEPWDGGEAVRAAFSQ